MGKLPANTYAVLWKCPQVEFNELLDKAGGPLSHKEIPTYGDYVLHLHEVVKDAIKQGVRAAFFVTIGTAQMRQEVERRGLPWGEAAWDRVAADMVNAFLERRHEDFMGDREYVSDVIFPAWHRDTGWTVQLRSHDEPSDDGSPR